MSIRRTPADPVLPDGRLDWSRARIGEPLPCQHCGRPAILRHPTSGRATHKVCGDAQAKHDATANRGAQSRQTTTERTAA